MEENQLPVALCTPDKTMASLLNEAVAQTLQRYQLDDVRQRLIYAFLLELSAGTPLFILLSQDGMDTWHAKTFNDSTHRAFVFSVYSAFIGRYSNLDEHWSALCALIARAGSIRLDDNHTSTPDVMEERLYTPEEIFASLKANTWLVVLSLIVMYWNSGIVMNTSSRG